MFFAGEYRSLGPVDVGPLRALIDALDPAVWDEQGSRQAIYKAHARTRTIPLIYDADMRHSDPTVLPLYDRFAAALRPAMDRIRDYFGPAHAAAGTPVDQGYFIRAILVRLASGGEVLSHTDNGPSLSRTHRIHLPIVTSEQALFAIAGNIRHLPVGELTEINNRRPHAVRNGGPDRIHAILDYVIPGEAIDDPDGPIVA